MAVTKQWFIGVALTVLAGVVVAYGWKVLNTPALPTSIAVGNGRIEATEVDVATRYAGRVAQVNVREGDWVEAGQVLASMDTEQSEAELREAQANLRQAREGERYAGAVVRQRESELNLARKDLQRAQQLVRDGHISRQELDQRNASMISAAAALDAARIQVEEATAAIASAEARVQRLTIVLQDSLLKAPRDGRVLYRLAEPGEVLPVGGKILTILDLSDVYMAIFLPTDQATRVALKAEGRIVLDAIPNVSAPAEVSFVASQAQFTPRSVETRTEREKLMFRVEVRLDPELVRHYASRIKTGIPGVAYVRLDPEVPWPAMIPPVVDTSRPIAEQ